MEEPKPGHCRPHAESLGDLVGEPTQAIDRIASFIQYVRDTSEGWHEEDRRDRNDDEEDVLKAERIVGQVWYRGQPDCRRSLRPGLYRPETMGPLFKPGPTQADGTKVFEALIDLEHELRIDFTSYGHLLNPLGYAKTPIDWYFLMQHHRIPTRLLDWTTNALAALFFALEGYQRRMQDRERIHENSVNPSQSASESEASEDHLAVWMVDAYWLAGRLSDEWDAPLLPWSEEASRYLPALEQLLENGRASKKLIPEDAMPIEPPAMHPRVAAQEGRFIIFGQKQDLLEHKIYRERESDCQLEKARIVQIPFVVGDNVDALFDELAHLGVSRRTLFPDLDGLAKFVRWKHFSRGRRP
jgi:hypothetical protein